MFGIGDCAVAADQIKDREPVLVANDSFAVDQAGADRQFPHRNRNKGKARRKIVPGARNQPHAGSVPARQDTEAVMLDFVNPARTGRRGLARLGLVLPTPTRIGCYALTLDRSAGEKNRRQDTNGFAFHLLKRRLPKKAPRLSNRLRGRPHTMRRERRLPVRRKINSA
jgi:hypothetical protein